MEYRNERRFGCPFKQQFDDVYGQTRCQEVDDDPADRLIRLKRDRSNGMDQSAKCPHNHGCNHPDPRREGAHARFLGIISPHAGGERAEYH
ncbi:hypothetical protein D3C76_485880 [compost metagenome]